MITKPLLCQVVFWNLDTLTKAAEALMPTISQVDQRHPYTMTHSVASRSMAYLPSTIGAVFVSSGTETMILQVPLLVQTCLAC